MSMFVKATKKQAKLRLAIAGASGSGKTYTALTLAKHIGGRVAVLDTERGSASKYSGDVAEFDTCQLEHFSVQNYLKVIRGAAESGYDVLIIDSLSHAWAGKGGILEEADKRGGKFGAWKVLTPIQQSLMDAILSYPGHVIATMRSKMAYEVTTDESHGKKETKVEKLGLAAVQRDDVSYEFDVMLDMDERNNARVTKTRCNAIAGQVIDRPGKALAATLMAWLSDGDAPAEARQEPAQTSREAQTGGARPLVATPTHEQAKPAGTTGQAGTAESEQTGLETGPKLDEYGLEIPASECPKVRPGKVNAGKRWDELPGPLVEKMYGEYGDRMSDSEREWAEYIMAKRQARKAREALEDEQAAADEALGSAEQSEAAAEQAGAA